MAAAFTTTAWRLSSSTLTLDNPRRFTSLHWHYQTTAPASGAYNSPFCVGLSSGLTCAQIYITGTGSSQFRFSIYDGTNFNESTDALRNQGVWYHVALVYDSTLQLWVNGSFVVSIAGAVPVAGIELGGDSFSTGFTGRLDDVRIYEGVALTPTQIQGEMSSRTPRLNRKYSMPFRFLNRQNDTNFTASDGTRPATLTNSGTAVWAEGAPVRMATHQRPRVRRRWGNVFGGGPPPTTNRRRRMLMRAAA